MNILLAAATEAEISPTLQWLREAWGTGDGQRFYRAGINVEVVCTGVGLIHSTAALTRVLVGGPFHFAVQAGVAGAYNRALQLGEVVSVREEVLGDLGAEDGDKFLDVFDLGLAREDDFPFTGGRLLRLPGEGAPAVFFSELKEVVGLTANTVSGRTSTIEARSKRWRPDVETMEGAPFHYCCLQAGIPFAQLRAISNYVEPRNRENWKMGEAIAALNARLIRCLQSL